MIKGLDKKYTNTGKYLVAFIDVLGVKNKVKKNVKNTLEELWLINNYLAKEQYKNKNLIIRTFSDNYLIAIKTNDDNFSQNFNDLGNIVGNLIARGLYMYHVLFRGAITYGDMHIDENIVLGEVLIRAYELESEIAIYPRIIVDKNIISVKSENATSYNLTDGIFQDIDLNWCLNALKFFEKKLAEIIESQLKDFLYYENLSAEQSKNQRVIVKIKWLINYVNSFYMQNYGRLLLDINND